MKSSEPYTPKADARARLYASALAYLFGQKGDPDVWRRHPEVVHFARANYIVDAIEPCIELALTGFGHK